jgi:mannose-6-phosphate isomerase-like protein (cupin superfamily)
MPATIPSRVLSLIAAVKAAFLQRQPADDAAGREIKKVLSLLEPLPPLTGGFQKSNHAATRCIEAALRAGNESTSALLDAIAPVIRFLPWHYSYPPCHDIPGLELNIAFAEIVGPEAPFRSDSVCLGLTLIGPEMLYPAHHHPAAELYLVAAGTATWTLNGEPRNHPPGAYVLHPSQAVHAMRTHAEPLLAVYSWTGPDVRTLSAYTKSVRSDETQRTNSPS